jgi:beta-galactosidase
VADKDGVPCGNGENVVSFKISGPGVIAAVDNADNGAHEPFQASQRTAYRGQCVALVKASTAGNITLTASAPDLADGTITITAVPAAAK